MVGRQLVQLGLADLCVATVRSATAGSRLVRTAIAYMLHLVSTNEHVPALGGLQVRTNASDLVPSRTGSQ